MGRIPKERNMRNPPVNLANGEMIRFSAGSHAKLIKAIIKEFAPRFCAGEHSNLCG